MSIEIITPASRDEWLKQKTNTVGCSELPAIFGAHKYVSPYKLWAIKSELHVDEFSEITITENPPSISFPPHERGNLFEDDALEMIQRLRPSWAITANPIPGGRMFIDRDAGLSSTPDCFVIEPGRPGRSTVQVKTMNEAVFKEQWLMDGIVEPPTAVAIQAIGDATLSNCDRAYAAAMVVGFRTFLYLIEVPLYPGLMLKSRDLVKDFWRRVRDNEPYSPEYERDAAVIAGIYANADDGGETDLSADPVKAARVAEILALRAPLKEREKSGSDAEKLRKPLDTELIYLLGNASRGKLADGRVISAKTTQRTGFTVAPTSYRAVKIIEAGAAPARGGKRAAPKATTPSTEMPF